MLEATFDNSLCWIERRQFDALYNVGLMPLLVLLIHFKPTFSFYIPWKHKNREYWQKKSVNKFRLLVY